MNDRADIVVVGGGIIGCCTALHLVRAGVGDVLLLERDDISQGTTAAGAGFVARWSTRILESNTATTVWGARRGSDIKAARAALENYAFDFYEELEQRGLDVGFRRNGIMWISTSETAWDEYLAPMASSQPPETQEIDGREVTRLAALTESASIHRALYQADAAQITAAMASQSIAACIVREGGRIQTRRPVEALRVSNGRVVGVDTPWGHVDAGAVVLSAGPWTNALLASAGRWLPMMPLTVARIVTSPVDAPASMPLLVLPEFNRLWLREWDGGGLLYGTDFAASPRYAFSSGDVPQRLDQLPLDGVWEMQRYARRASGLLPALGTDHSITVTHGAPCLTPDGIGLVGALPELDGVFVAAGCNAYGISYGPGYGKVIAELLVGDSRKIVDHALLSPDRFADRHASLDQAVLEIKGLYADRSQQDQALDTVATSG